MALLGTEGGTGDVFEWYDSKREDSHRKDTRTGQQI
jgi:hypothetical protein